MARGLDEGLEQHGAIAVALMPVVGQLARASDRIFEARPLDWIQGRIRKRALLTTSCRFFGAAVLASR